MNFAVKLLTRSPQAETHSFAGMSCCDPLCLAKQEHSFLLHPKPCVWDSVWHQRIEAAFPASEVGPGARGGAAVGVIAPNSCDTESGGADRECLGLAVRRAGPPTPGPWVQGEGKRKHLTLSVEKSSCEPSRVTPTVGPGRPRLPQWQPWHCGPSTCG